MPCFLGHHPGNTPILLLTEHTIFATAWGPLPLSGMLFWTFDRFVFICFRSSSNILSKRLPLATLSWDILLLPNTRGHIISFSYLYNTSQHITLSEIILIYLFTVYLLLCGPHLCSCLLNLSTRKAEFLAFFFIDESLTFGRALNISFQYKFIGCWFYARYYVFIFCFIWSSQALWGKSGLSL